MRTSNHSIALIAAVAGLIASCNQVELPQQVIPGQRINSISFSLTTPAPTNVVSTKAMTDADETNVESLALFFFKEGNTGAANRVFVSGTDFDMSAPDVVTPTNYIYSITLDEDDLDSEINSEVICSGNWYIYAVANWNKSWCSVDLGALKSKSRAELDDLRIVKSSSSPNPSETAILLAGRYGEDNTGLAVLDPDADGNITLTGKVHLRRFVSKITFRFNSGTDVNFVPERIFIYNYSRSATLFERSGWEQKDGTESYKYGTFSGNLTKAVAASGSVMADATNAGIGYEVLHDTDGYYYTFYMPENIPTGKEGAVINNYNDRDKCTYAANGARNFTNAPDDATYVVVSGTYSGPAIELDHDNGTVSTSTSSDKRVEGNVSYTIHLGNFSTTGANTLGSDDNFTVRRNAKYNYNVTVNGVNSIAVEAAFDEERNSGAEGNLITTASGTTNIRLDAHYEQVIIAIPDGVFQSYELILDTPYSGRQIVNGRNDDLDVNWVKFAKPASETSFRTYAQVHAGPMGNIFDLTEDLNDGDESDANNTYYIKGNDGKRYTAAYINEYYYEELGGDVNDLSLSKFINAPDRKLIFSSGVETSSDGHSSFTVTPIFAIRQRSIVSPYDVDNVTNPFGIETVEETEESDTFGGNGSDYNHGWANTTSGMSQGNANWRTYVSEADNGHINNGDIPASAVTTEGAKGIYQCLSRNRDLNGDGKINSGEVRWYLPATEQTNTIWYGDPFLTEEQHVDKSNRYFNSNKTLYLWWALEGVAYNAQNRTARVRCIRSLANYNEESTKVWSATTSSDGNTVFSISGLNEAAGRNDRQIGEYQPHFAGDKENDKLPAEFVVAKDYLSFTRTIEEKYITHAYEPLSHIYGPVNCSGSSWYQSVSNFDKTTQGIEVSMVLDDTSVNTQDIISFGSSTSYNKWRDKGNVVHFYYPSEGNSQIMQMCINNQADVNRTNITVEPGKTIHITFNGDVIVVNGISYTLSEKNSNWTNFNETTVYVGSAEGSTYSHQSAVNIELVDMTKAPTIIEEILSSEETHSETFSKEEITGSNLCAANYYENAEKSDLGLWRVPNEKEFSVMFSAQKDGIGTFMKASTGCRTKFERTTEKGYSGNNDLGTSMFYYLLSSGNNPAISTSLSDIPQAFYVRCVRDASTGSSSEPINDSDQNSMSYGGNLW